MRSEEFRSTTFGQTDPLPWLFGLPAPLLVVAAPGWAWVVAANVLLGVHQALCWSVTVIMKIDLAGPDRRGTATAANEWGGYLGVAVAAIVTGYVAGSFAPRPGPFYFGTALAVAGLSLSLSLVRDTQSPQGQGAGKEADVPSGDSFVTVFWRTSWQNRSLRSGLWQWLAAAVVMGLGTAAVYPTFLAAVSDVADESWRASSLGTFRLWRDSGYVLAGAEVGPLADAAGSRWAIGATAVALLVSGMFTGFLLRETLSSRTRGAAADRE